MIMDIHTITPDGLIITVGRGSAEVGDGGVAVSVAVMADFTGVAMAVAVAALAAGTLAGAEAGTGKPQSF